MTESSRVDSLQFLPPPATQPRLRVGLMLDQLTVEAWQYRAIESICGLEWLDLAVVVVCWSPQERRRRWFENLLNLQLHSTSEIYDLYERLGRRICAGRRAARHYVSRDLVQLLDGVPLMHVVPRRGKRVFDRFPEADVEALRALDLDVLVRFGFRILKGEVLSAARHGVWSYHHGDPAAFRGGPACFWEMARGEPTIGVVLQRLTERLDGGEVLYQSTSSCPATFWTENARSPHFLKSSMFLRRALARLHRSGALPAVTEPKKDGCGPLYRKPGNLLAAGLLARLAWRSGVASVANLARQSEWSIIVRRAAAPPTAPRGEVKAIGRLGGRDWQAADPCLFAHEGRLYCFFERMPRSGGIGQICCVQILDDDRLTEPQVVLSCEHHLSYPFVFNWQGDVFLAAETGDVGGVRIWQADRFPLVWRQRSTTLEGVRAYDPTLLEWKGRWYLFVTIDESGGGSDDELFLFHADSPFGPWTAHPENPIVSDCRTARPAGALFVEDGRLLRPVQDCSGRYGKAINLCEVEELSPTTYRQSVVASFDPADPRGIGCHTLSRYGEVEAIDIRRTALRWGGLRGIADRSSPV